MTVTYAYPLETPRDYMILRVYPYVSRTGRAPRANGGRVEGNPPPIDTIRLPFPELPQMVSNQKYSTLVGAFNNALASGLGEAYSAIDESLQQNSANTIDVGGIAERLKAQVSNGGPVARELAANIAGGIVGISGGAFQTLASGEITNPNIELLYSGPSLRSYSFNFTFAPKSEREAFSCYEITRRLKTYHLPSSSGSAGMLQVPNLFTIDLFVNSQRAEFYQKYFKCALESIAVKQDTSGQHITLPNGEPVVSSLSMVFREIKITTAEDFKNNI